MATGTYPSPPPKKFARTGPVLTPQISDMIRLNRQLLKGLGGLVGWGRRGHVKVHSNEYNYTGLYPYPLPASVQNAQNTLSLFTDCCVTFSLFTIQHNNDYLHIRCWKESCLAFTCALNNNK